MKWLNRIISFLTVFAIMSCLIVLHDCFQKLGEIDQKFAECDTISSQPAEPTYISLYLPVPQIEEEKPIEPVKTSLGIFTATGYCPCEICCGQWSNIKNPITASGARAAEGITVGADWGTIPKGTEIYIEALGKRVVQDKPAKWIIDKYDGKILDLFFSTHKEALKFGKQQLEVWINE